MLIIITHANCRFSLALLFHTVSQKMKRLESPNLTEMFHYNSWKPIYFIYFYIFLFELSYPKN